jgi:hypothetical protein
VRQPIRENSAESAEKSLTATEVADRMSTIGYGADGIR